MSYYRDLLRKDTANRKKNNAAGTGNSGQEPERGEGGGYYRDLLRQDTARRKALAAAAEEARKKEARVRRAAGAQAAPDGSMLKAGAGTIIGVGETISGKDALIAAEQEQARRASEARNAAQAENRIALEGNPTMPGVPQIGVPMTIKRIDEEKAGGSDYQKQRAGIQREAIRSLENKIQEIEQAAGGNTLIHAGEKIALQESLAEKKLELAKTESKYRSLKAQEEQAEQEATPLSEYERRAEAANSAYALAVAERQAYERKYGGNMQLYDLSKYNTLESEEERLRQAMETAKSDLWTAQRRELFKNAQNAADLDLFSAPDEKKGGKDDTWRYINDDKYRAQAEAQSLSYGTARGKLQYSYMTDKEKEAYNYIYNRYGKKTADEYLEYLTFDLNARQQQKIRQVAEEGKLELLPNNKWTSAFASLLSVPANLMSGAGFIDVAAQKLQRDLTGSAKPIDYNRSAQTMYNAAQGTRQGTAEKFKTAGGQFMYQTVMSMADSLGVMGLSLIGVPGTTFLLGGSAATDAMHQAKEAGATDDQAIAMGFLSGAAETVFEEFSLEYFLDWFKSPTPKNIKQVLKNIMLQGAGEGSEEFFTTIANTISEMAVLGDAAEMQRNAKEYIELGATEDEAKRLVVQEWLEGLSLDALGGFVSGGLFGIGGSIAQQGRDVYNRRQQGKNIKSDGNTGLEVLSSYIIKNGEKYGAGTVEKAQEIADRIASGDKVSNSMAGQLVELIEADNPEFMKNTWPTLANEIDRRAETAEKEKAVPEDTDSTAVNEGENKRLTSDDYDEYMRTGKTQHTRNKKARSAEAGNSPVLTTVNAVREFLSNAIHGKASGEVKAYGKVGERFANAVKAVSGDTDISGYYLEIDADSLRRSYNEHLNAKEAGDINLSEQDFLNIPDYIDNFDYVLAVENYNGKKKIRMAKKINGYTVILETVSSERHAVHVLKMLGMSTEKFEQRYSKQIEKAAGSQGGKNAQTVNTTSLHTDSGLFEGGFTQASDAQGPENTSDTSLASQSPTTTVTQEMEKSKSGDNTETRNEVKENGREQIQDSERSGRGGGESAGGERTADAGASESVQSHDTEGVRGDNAAGRVYTAGDGQEGAGGLGQQDTAINRQNSVRAYGVEPISSQEAGIKKGSRSETVFEMPVELYDNELKTIAADAEKNGVELHVYTGILSLKNGRIVDGYHKNGVVWIKADSNRRTATEAYDHEKFHMAVGRNKGAFAAVASWVKAMDKGRLAGIVEKYVQRYRDAYDLDSMSEDEAFCAVMEEILADAYAGADVFKADATEYTQTARSIAEELGATKNSEYNRNQGRAPPQGMTYEDVKNAVREVISELTGNKSGTQTQESGEKYSLNDGFEKAYDNWNQNYPDEHISLFVGYTSEALQSIGVKDQRITWDTGKILKIKKAHPAMTDSVLKQVPQIIENPVLIMRSKQSESRLTMFGEVSDANGVPVLAVLELHPTNKNGIEIDELKIASTYGKDSTQSLINTSEILYIDKNKNRTNQWLRDNRLQLPFSSTTNGSAHSIRASETKSQENIDSGKYAISPEEDRIDRKDISAVQSIGRKSINSFTSEDIKTTERYARQYYQEMGTKSPFFRAWFGDWRANDATPVAVARKRDDARGRTRNNDTGWDINVSRQVFNETKSHNGIANITAKPYLPYINDIIKNAVLLDSWGIGKTKSENSLLMHSLYAVADIGNGPEIIKLYVEEMNDPNSTSTAKRAYQLQNIESQQLQVTGSENFPSRIMQTADIETVSDLFAAVKSKDRNFTPKPVNPVMLNDDGTPRVFYHGTDSSFTEFKASEFGSREGSYFFAQNYEDAAAYTASGNVMEVYVSLENPIDYNDMPSEIYKLRDKRAQVEALKKLGYDGWYADMDTGWGEVSAFYPEQIKSATDNIGTFNSGDGDIRYAIAGERSRTADLQSLREAKRRASEGEDAGSIYEETGWYQGSDGKWRYEIDDSGMEYHRGGDAAFSESHPKYARYQELLSRAIFGSLSAEEQTELRSLDEIWGREYGRLSERIDRGNGYLSDIIKHDKLFEAYPELRAVRVEFGDTRESRGQYNQSRNTIVVSEQLRNAPESTLLHEIQHAIQKTEGFAEGANPEYWEGVLKRGEQIYSKGMNEALNALIEFEANPENAPVIEAYKDLNRTELEGDPEDRYDRVYQWAQDMGYGDRLTEYEDLLFDFELEKERQNSKTPRELYYNTAGEEEARDVSARRGMSAAERRRNMPGTGNRDTVFAKRGGTDASYSIKNTSEMSLKEQLKKYYNNTMASSDAFYFGQATTEYGLSDAPIAMTQRAFKKSTVSKHNVPRRVLNNLAKNLSQPILSFKDGSKIAYLINDIDGDGKQVLVAVDTDAVMDRERVNAIDSIYGIDSPERWIANQANSGKEFMLYNEKEANAFLQTYGYLASVGESGKCFIQKISQQEYNVKDENERYALSPEEDKREIKYPEFSQHDITENIESLSYMDSVYDVDGVKLKRSGKRPSELYSEFFESIGNRIYSDRFGSIALTRSSIKSEIRHGTTAEKLASIEAIPAVISSGEVIFANRKAQSDVDRIVVAAPIRIDNESYYMGVMLQRDSQNQRLYLHNVAIEKEIPNTAQADLLTTGADAVNENLFITKILQNAIAVKKNVNSEKNKLAEAEELADSEAMAEENRRWERETEERLDYQNAWELAEADRRIKKFVDKAEGTLNMNVDERLKKEGDAATPLEEQMGSINDQLYAEKRKQERETATAELIENGAELPEGTTPEAVAEAETTAEIKKANEKSNASILIEIASTAIDGASGDKKVLNRGEFMLVQNALANKDISAELNEGKYAGSDIDTVKVQNAISHFQHYADALSKSDMKLPSQYDGLSASELEARLKAESAAEKSARLEIVERENFEGSRALDKLGIKITGSKAKYFDISNVRSLVDANSKIIREMNRAIKKLHADPSERAMAQLIADNQMDAKSIPDSMDSDRILELADIYGLKRLAQRNVLAEQKHYIKKLNRELAEERFRGAEHKKRIGVQRMNYMTPRRIMIAMFGEQRGREIYNSYFAPVRANEAERTRWADKMMKDAGSITGADGKAGKLSKEERALVQMLIEGKAAAEAVKRMETEAGTRVIELAEKIVSGVTEKKAGSSSEFSAYGDIDRSMTDSEQARMQDRLDKIRQERRTAEELARRRIAEEAINDERYKGVIVDSAKIRNAVEYAEGVKNTRKIYAKLNERERELLTIMLNTEKSLEARNSLEVKEIKQVDRLIDDIINSGAEMRSNLENKGNDAKINRIALDLADRRIAGEAMQSGYYNGTQINAERIRTAIDNTKPHDISKTLKKSFEGYGERKSRLTPMERELAIMMYETRESANVLESMSADDRTSMNAIVDDILENGEDARQERRTAEQYAVWLMADRAKAGGKWDGKKIDSVRIDNAVKHFTERYNDMYEAINDFLVAHGTEPIGFIKGYAPHTQPQEALAPLEQIFNWMAAPSDITELRAALAGKTHEFKPYKRWVPNFLSRSGDSVTNYDIYDGYESYIRYVSDVLYHMDDIMRLREASTYLREDYVTNHGKEVLSQIKDMRERGYFEKMKFLEANDRVRPGQTMTGYEIDDAMDRYTEDILKSEEKENAVSSSLVMWLDNYTNLLSGKQNAMDRGLEQRIGRKGIRAANRMVNHLIAVQVVGNMSSSLNQFAQMPLTMAELGPVNTALALKDIITGGGKIRQWALDNDFLATRRGVSVLNFTPTNRVSQILSTPLEYTDYFMSLITARAAYRQGLATGMSDSAAMKYSVQKSEDIMGSRAKGTKPVAFDTKNPIMRLVNAYQIEALNQWEHIGRDMPLHIKEIARTKGIKAAAGEAAKELVQYLIYAFLINRLCEATYGGTPAPLDLIGITGSFVAAGNGFTLNEGLIRWINGVFHSEVLKENHDFDAIREKNFADGFDWSAAWDDLKYSASTEIPLVSNMLAALGLTDDKTVFGSTVSDTKKYIKGMTEAIGEKNVGESLYNAMMGLSEWFYGGREVQKAAEGIRALRNNAGVTGSGKLSYPVEATAGTVANGVLFGKNALPGVQDYYAAGGSPMSDKNAELYRALVSAGEKPGDMYNVIHKLSGITGDKDEDGETIKGSAGLKKMQYIEELDISEEAKNILFANVITDAAAKDYEEYEIAKSGVKEEDWAMCYFYWTGLSGEDKKRDFMKYLKDEGYTNVQIYAIMKACGYKK